MVSFSQVSASGDRACLVVIYGPELGKRAPIGTAPSDRSLVEERSADRSGEREPPPRAHHLRRAAPLIEDLGSTNGTFVNDERVTAAHR